MVKSKKLMYALLVASALVWGWVFVKIFNVVFKQDEALLTLKKVKPVYDNISDKDTFELLANYKDPFLKTRSRQNNYAYSSTGLAQSNTPVKKKSAVVKPVKVEKVIDWSFIKYKGRITRKATGKTVSLINIGGGDYSIEDGKEVQQVLLLKSYPDSIQVKFDGVKTYIKRNLN